VKRSASHQTSPASSASRSVSDMGGSALRASEKIGLVMKSRRKELMAISLKKGFEQRRDIGRFVSERSVTERVKNQASVRIENKAKVNAVIPAYGRSSGLRGLPSPRPACGPQAGRGSRASKRPNVNPAAPSRTWHRGGSRNSR